MKEKSVLDGFIPDANPIFVPDTLTPEQYFGNLRGHNQSGEHRLQLAVLEDAINRHNWAITHPNSGKAQVAAREVHVWLEANEEGPMTFEAIAEAMGFDAGIMRKLIRARKHVPVVRHNARGGNEMVKTMRYR